MATCGSSRVWVSVFVGVSAACRTPTLGVCGGLHPLAHTTRVSNVAEESKRAKRGPQEGPWRALIPLMAVDVVADGLALGGGRRWQKKINGELDAQEQVSNTTPVRTTASTLSVRVLMAPNGWGFH